MMPLLSIDPHTSHCAKQAHGGARRVEKAARSGNLSGEWTAKTNLNARPGKSLCEDAPSRFETYNIVSVWDCVQPDAAFAAQAIAQALPAGNPRVAFSYCSTRPIAARLLDRHV